MEEFSVLLVDDEEDFLRTIIKRLSKRGIRAQGASRGEQALAMLARVLTEPVTMFARAVKAIGEKQEGGAAVEAAEPAAETA